MISWRDLEERALLAAEAAEEGARRAAHMATLEPSAGRPSQAGGLRLKLGRALVQLGARIHPQATSELVLHSGT